MSVDAAVLGDLARARRSRRLADVDIFEKLYQAYLSVITVGVALAAAASVVGDDRVSASTLHRVMEDGPALVGLVVAVVLVIGLRSGARGGPLTLEAPFVSHVLLSPVPRDLSLREPALRQLRQAVIMGGGIGGLIAVTASHRLPVASLPLIAWAVLAGAVTGVAATGAAMFVAGFPVAKPIVHVLSFVLLVGAAVDLALGTAWSPGGLIGRLALGGVHVDAMGFIAIPVALVIAFAGVRVVGGLSIEAARRRPAWSRSSAWPSPGRTSARWCCSSGASPRTPPGAGRGSPSRPAGGCRSSAGAPRASPACRWCASSASWPCARWRWGPRWAPGAAPARSSSSADWPCGRPAST